MPSCLLSEYCWFRPVCASSPAVVSAQSWSSGRGKGPRVWLGRLAARVVELRSGGNVSALVGRWFLQEGQRCRGFYSNSYGEPVPEILTAPVAYHAIVLCRSLRSPYSEVRSVLPA
ncbi:hypothetical protein BHE74_00057753, partial [Ensete ventricosum]